MITNLVLSFVRTIVPVVIGFLIANGLLSEDLSGSAIEVLTAVIIGAYYLVARLLEKKWPALGWLLGAPREPSYSG